MRRVSGHGNRAGIETAEERRNIFEVRRIEQQHRLSGGVHVGQTLPDELRFAMKLAPTEIDSRNAVVDQKRIRDTFRLNARAPFEQVHERGKVRTNRESRIRASYCEA